MLLNDFQRGKLPHYVKPPGWTENDEEKAEKEQLQMEAEKKTENESEIAQPETTN